MQRSQILKSIKWASVGWMVIALALAGFAYGDLMPMSLFEALFAGGFVLFAVVSTILSRMLMQHPPSTDGGNDDDGSSSS